MTEFCFRKDKCFVCIPLHVGIGLIGAVVAFELGGVIFNLITGDSSNYALYGFECFVKATLLGIFIYAGIAN